jgi:hypothetical protein
MSWHEALQRLHLHELIEAVERLAAGLANPEEALQRGLHLVLSKPRTSIFNQVGRAAPRHATRDKQAGLLQILMTADSQIWTQVAREPAHPAFSMRI